MTESFTVTITDPAQRDIETIYQYICVHGSSDIAGGILRKMLNRIDSLATFPRRGSPVAEFEGTEDVRQFVIGVYRGVYIIEDRTVLIVAIFDGRRNVRALLERRILYRLD